MQALGQVPKVPKVPEKVWEGFVQSQVRFHRVPEKVPVEVWEALVQSVSSAWLRSTLEKDLLKYNIAAVGDTTEACFISIYFINTINDILYTSNYISYYRSL